MLARGCQIGRVHVGWGAYSTGIGPSVGPRSGKKIVLLLKWTSRCPRSLGAAGGASPRALHPAGRSERSEFPGHSARLGAASTLGGTRGWAQRAERACWCIDSPPPPHAIYRHPPKGFPGYRTRVKYSNLIHRRPARAEGIIPIFQ